MSKGADSAVQLSMDFASGANPLVGSLRDGSFITLVEWDTPLRDQPFDSAMALGLALADVVKRTSGVAGMVLTDRQRGHETHDPVRTLAGLAAATGKPIVATLSGKGTTLERIREQFAASRSVGEEAFLCVTGDRADGHEVLRRRGSRQAGTPSYAGSVAQLSLLRTLPGKRFLGAGVNPFKYNPADQYLQYYKMVRKLASGAEFLVCHAGWDMKKLQEVQWYLQMRELNVPVLARVALLSPETIRDIHGGFMPGVHLSRNFAAMLQRQASLSDTQSLAAQLNRIGLQVAGCRLLGFNGIQLCGVRDASTLKMVLKRVAESLEKYTDYDAWLTAWGEFHNFMDFAPQPDAYYVFSNLLSKGLPAYDPQQSAFVQRELPEATRLDSTRAALVRRAREERLPAAVAKLVEAVLCRRCGGRDCHLECCEYLCPSDCPKGLVYGPCGGTYPDGTCEFGAGRCFFHRVLALASKRHELDALEAEVSHV